MFKNIGENSLTRMFELIEEKINYLKSLIDGKSANNHTHSYNELSNKPTIPTIPSSLPANGGNADTVDGYHIRVTTDVNDTGQKGYITFIV